MEAFLSTHLSAVIIGLLIGCLSGYLTVKTMRSRARRRIALNTKLLRSVLAKGRRNDAQQYVAEIHQAEQSLPYQEHGTAEAVLREHAA